MTGYDETWAIPGTPASTWTLARVLTGAPGCRTNGTTR